MLLGVGRRGSCGLRKTLPWGRDLNDCQSLQYVLLFASRWSIRPGGSLAVSRDVQSHFHRSRYVGVGSRPLQRASAAAHHTNDSSYNQPLTTSCRRRRARWRHCTSSWRRRGRTPGTRTAALGTSSGSSTPFSMPRHKVGSEWGRTESGVSVKGSDLSTRMFLSPHAPASSPQPSTPLVQRPPRSSGARRSTPSTASIAASIPTRTAIGRWRTAVTGPRPRSTRRRRRWTGKRRAGRL